MKLTRATFTQLAPQFGQSLYRSDDPVQQAAEWLWTTHTKQRRHEEVLVQSCMAPVPEPTGVARVDKLLDENSETGFMSGNVSSNVQSSQIIPAARQLEVNGFNELDGQPICLGDLQFRAFQQSRKSSWISREHQYVMDEIYKVLAPSPPKGVPLDEASTFVHVLHMRLAAVRHSYPTPVVTHGFMLIGERGEVHYKRQVNPSPVSSKMMARAEMALTCERYDPVDMLRIEGGKFTFVHNDVLLRLESEGHDTSQIDLSHLQADEANTSDAPSQG